ncbi:MAG TPA: FtsH protease activity modulator HflK [Steroidobacteraceae bacterium]|nr:FtsH protease activity modulator HflK [Steroidobacteraceae bacterium]
MAWNEPGNRGGSPWGKKRPAGESGGIGQLLAHWRRQLRSALGAGPPADGNAAPAPGRFAWIVVALLLLLWLLSGYYQVDAAERGVVQRFGRFSGVRGPGWGMIFPWPIEHLTRVNVSQLSSHDYHQVALTSDVNLVDLRVDVQYRKADPVKVLFHVKDLEQTLADAGESAIREVVGQTSLDDVLGAARQHMNEAMRERMQRMLDGGDSGIRVASVNLTDVQVPDQVLSAQRDANKAGEDRGSAASKAQAAANDLLPRAQGQAQHQLEDAAAYKTQVVAQAKGDVARFNSVYAVYAQAPEVTRERMYLDTIEAILRDSRKIVLDTKNGSTIYLPLDKLLEHGVSTARPAAPAVEPAAPAAAPAAPEEQSQTAVDGDGRDRRERQ